MKPSQRDLKHSRRQSHFLARGLLLLTLSSATCLMPVARAQNAAPDGAAPSAVSFLKLAIAPMQIGAGITAITTDTLDTALAAAAQEAPCYFQLLPAISFTESLGKAFDLSTYDFGDEKPDYVLLNCNVLIDDRKTYTVSGTLKSTAKPNVPGIKISFRTLGTENLAEDLMRSLWRNLDRPLEVISAPPRLTGLWEDVRDHAVIRVDTDKDDGRVTAVRVCTTDNAREQVYTTAPANGSYLFAKQDLKDGPALIGKLAGQATPLAKWLWGRFSDEEKQRLNDNGNRPAQQATLLEGLNDVVMRSFSGEHNLLAAPNLTQGVSISGWTQHLAGKSQKTKNEFLLMHRLFLSDAFPGELKPFTTRMTWHRFEGGWSQGKFKGKFDGNSGRQSPLTEGILSDSDTGTTLTFNGQNPATEETWQRIQPALGFGDWLIPDGAPPEPAVTASLDFVDGRISGKVIGETHGKSGWNRFEGLTNGENLYLIFIRMSGGNREIVERKIGKLRIPPEKSFINPAEIEVDGKKWTFKPHTG